MNTREVRDILHRFGLHARKRLGQNFLIDDDALDDIIASAEITPEDTVVEVGPGLGVLTRELARHAGRVVAVELDDDLVTVLRSTLSGIDNVRVVHGDVLKLAPAEILAKARPANPAPSGYKVVANLPYYITSPALRHFLEANPKPRLLVLMVQKEVAGRLIAQPGDLSLLGVSVQVYGRPRRVRLVPASSFFPPPKVDSAVVRIDVYDRPAVDVDLEAFFRVVSAGFSRPRKQLHNALAHVLWFPPAAAAVVLRRAGIDPARRAQSLSLEEWERLTRAWLDFEAEQQAS